MLTHLIQQSCKVSAVNSLSAIRDDTPVGKEWPSNLAEVIHVVNDGARVWAHAV